MSISVTFNILVVELCSWWKRFVVATCHSIVTYDVCRSIKDIHRMVWLAVYPATPSPAHVPLRDDGGYTKAPAMLCRGTVLQISLIKASTSPAQGSGNASVPVRWTGFPFLSPTLIPRGRSRPPMPVRRIVRDMVSLPDRKVLIICGVMNGAAVRGVG